MGKTSAPDYVCVVCSVFDGKRVCVLARVCYLFFPGLEVPMEVHRVLLYVCVFSSNKDTSLPRSVELKRRAPKFLALSLSLSRILRNLISSCAAACGHRNEEMIAVVVVARV